MNKKVLPGILLLLMLLTSLVILSGGCGGNGALDNSGNNNNENNNNQASVDSALNGVWTSSNSGTAHITNLNADNEDMHEEIIEQLKIISPDAYELYQKSLRPESVSANVSSAAVIFEDSNISEDTGSVKLTAAIIVNYENNMLPVLLNGVKLTTKRSSSNTWTAAIPDYDGELTISVNSSGSMTLSGTITYIDHEWEFSTVINKNTYDDLLESPSEILEGVWKFDTAQTGAYISDTGMLSNITPEDVDVSIAFGAENNSITRMAASYYVSLNSARNALDNETADTGSEFTSVTVSSGTLTQILGNLYKFTDENKKETLIFIENSDKIYVFTSDSESDSDGTAYMYLPMKKSSGFNLESAMNKSWSASGSENGGGYLHFTNLDTKSDPLLALMENLPFILKNCTLNLQDVNTNDDNTVTAKINLASVFTLTSEFFKSFMPQEELDMPVDVNSEETFKMIGNVLVLNSAEDNEEGVFYISFISDSEALLTIEVKSNTGDEYDGTMKFVAVLSAN